MVEDGKTKFFISVGFVYAKTYAGIKHYLI